MTHSFYITAIAVVVLIIGIGALAVHIVIIERERRKNRQAVLHTVSHIRSFLEYKGFDENHVVKYLAFLANMFDDVLECDETNKLVDVAQGVERGNISMGRYLIERVLDIISTKQKNGVSVVFRLTQEGIAIYRELCGLIASEGGAA